VKKKGALVNSSRLNISFSRPNPKFSPNQNSKRSRDLAFLIKVSAACDTNLPKQSVFIKKSSALVDRIALLVLNRATFIF
jgi:hypothetical protein